MNKAKLAAVIRREMRDCVGLSGGKLSADRENLKNAYYGAGYAVDAKRAADGWSTYVDRTVMETVEWAKGPLLKVFAGSDELVRFEPCRPEEEQHARDATDYVNRVVFGRNAFDLVYGPLTDGLYQRVGWAKAFFEQKENRVRFKELSDLSAPEAEAVLTQAQTAGLEAEVSQDETTGLYDINLSRTDVSRQIRVLPLPSERVIYAADATDIATARFVAHWEDRMAGELIAEGYSRELVESLPGDQNNYPETRVQRGVNSEDEDAGNGLADSRDATRRIRIYEAYLLADSGKGTVDRYKVVYAGDADKVIVLEHEPWTMDRPPLFAACSLPLPYSPVGLSMADLVMDIQSLRSEMMRDVLDNMYLSNHGEMHLNRRSPSARVNYDQFLSRAPGGVYETEGEVTLEPLPVGNISQSALAGLELTDKLKEQRTGVGMTTQGLSADALQNTATGAAIQEEAQNVRLEMVARVYAETFYKPMARYVLALAVAYLREPVRIRRRGSFADITPAAWNPDMPLTVAVGLGTGSRQKQAGSVQQLMDVQNHIVTSLGKQSPVRLTHIIKSAHKLAEALGFEAPEQYFGTLEDAAAAEQAIMEQSEQAEQPSPEQQLLEMQRVQGEQKLEIQRIQGEQKLALEREKASADLQNDTARMRMNAELRMAELQQKGMLSQRQMELEAELDSVKTASGLPKAGADQVTGVGTL